ncbi:hypothetical protein EFE22_09495 [Lactobacillus delbrueckii subsp. lactis]|uniref:hypothetical protein n=1 Tax=Lactobacillus delbrueckii TaxID=1584 RepID=UPI001E3D45B6|nr:hypothetical protein [Lactobacillus delbrueckii]MCD5439807.1 hypothetical protein [Lactobacillus delbrueckii subsp. lactis]MCD5531046.1 hypothetical protein [Lactobacillus delbrueckii subsp. lactis]MCS8615957.1 hypothetical protein [Lactobacillus delbrueckii subsp. lactis]
MISYKATIRMKASTAITSIANKVEGQSLLFAGTELITELLASGVNPNLLDQAVKTVNEKLEGNEYEFY